MAVEKIKQYTAEEFFAFTEKDENRYELHNGEIVALAAPSKLHQRIVREMLIAVSTFIKSRKGSCEPFAAPFDVKLDDENVVQPDLMIICDPNKTDDKRCNGAPDFVAEITSSNSYNDYVRKLHLYESSGVREYWIVDPDKKIISVYNFEKETNEIYSFAQSVPVGIYEGELTINLNELLNE